jgi:hypothetical protein
VYKTDLVSLSDSRVSSGCFTLAGNETGKTRQHSLQCVTIYLHALYSPHDSALNVRTVKNSAEAKRNHKAMERIIK